MPKDTYVLSEESARRIVKATKQVEANPPGPTSNRKTGSRRDVIVAKITDKATGNGFYKAEQVVWNGSAWVTLSGGLTWDGASNLSTLYEINADAKIDDLIDMSVYTYVFPYLVGGSDGSYRWVFEWAFPYSVKVSNDDTTPNYLAEKIRDYAGNAIGTIANPAGNEQMWLPDFGDVKGPASAYDTAIARFDGVTGKKIEDSKGRISDTGVFQLMSVDGSDSITLEHDNSHAYLKWNDGALILQTDEGVNTDTTVLIEGKGTGTGALQLRDEDNSEWLGMGIAAQVGRIGVFGTSPANLYIQEDGKADVDLFPACASTTYPALTISGRDSGDALRKLTLKVDSASADTFKMTGLTNFNLDSILTVNSAFTLPAADGGVDEVMKTNGAGALSWTAMAAADEKVKISANDTTAGYLLAKVVVDASKWLELEEINNGGDEDLKIKHIGPVNGNVDTIGNATEGSEAAEGTTYDGTSSANGLLLYAMTRVAYYDASNEILYGYIRALRFDVRGHLQAVSAETRVSIDVPVVC